MMGKVNEGCREERETHKGKKERTGIVVTGGATFIASICSSTLVKASTLALSFLWRME
jgi:hypothetical protein